MAIKKQEFYEGAALHQLARDGDITSIHYEEPFFHINDMHVLLKHSGRGRSPWGFTFTSDEQSLLRKMSADGRVVIGLVCGADGVAACEYEAYELIAAPRKVSIHVSCYRTHGQHYSINGPDGTLDGKVPPSAWKRILKRVGGNHEA
jgi:hypothetical protein